MASQGPLTKRIFGEFRKVEENDDGTLTVSGVASSGNRDDAGELILPEAMKAALPDYMRFANIREMHDAKAAGIAMTADVDDDGFTNIETVIVDPVAITKVKTGVYKGFSIGGKVLARDPNDRTVITKIRLSEISLVDRPCNPDAMIGLWKAADVEPEGSDMAYAPTNDEVKAAAEEMAKAAGKTGKTNDFILKAREKLIADHEAAQADLVEKRGRVVAEVKRQAPALTEEQVEKVANGAVFVAAQPFDEQLEGAVTEAIAKAAAADTAADTGADTVAGAETVGGTETGADTVASGAGGEDSIAGAEGAEKAAGGGAPDKVDLAAALEAAIEKADSLTVPADAPAIAPQVTPGLADFGKGLAKLGELYGDDPLVKGLWTVSSLARLIDELACVQSCAAWEAKDEDDGSTVPTELATAVQALGQTLVNMASEEVAELVAAMKERGADIEIVIVEDDADMAYAAAVVDLVKADTALMEKAGARNSKKDSATIQKMHDQAVELGASCADGASKAAGEGDDLAKLGAVVEKALPAIERLNKSLEEVREANAELRKRLEVVEASPAAPKAAGSVHAIKKGEDVSPGDGDSAQKLTASQVQAELAKMDPQDRAMLLTKAALGLPISAA